MVSRCAIAWLSAVVSSSCCQPVSCSSPLSDGRRELEPRCVAVLASRQLSVWCQSGVLPLVASPVVGVAASPWIVVCGQSGVHSREQRRISSSCRQSVGRWWWPVGASRQVQSPVAVLAVASHRHRRSPWLAVVGWHRIIVGAEAVTVVVVDTPGIA